MPAYVIGFAFLGLFEFAGPLQTALRRWLGPGARLPELRSCWGVALMMTLVFYPYVYLLARAAFASRAPAALETRAQPGRSRCGASSSVTLPLARPSLAAGVALAMMEALADFGTVATFGYRTLTEAIYRVWYGMFDRVGGDPARERCCSSSPPACSLLERASRGRARGSPRAAAGAPAASGCASAGSGARRPPRRAPPCSASPSCCRWASSLVGPSGASARARARGLRRAPRPRPSRSPAAPRSRSRPRRWSWPMRAGASHSARARRPRALAGTGLRAAGRGHRGGRPRSRWPGSTGRWRRCSRACSAGRSGLLLTGSAVGLLFAYVVRFLAVGLQTVDASLTRIPPSLDDAARSLGAAARAARSARCTCRSSAAACSPRSSSSSSRP